MKENECIDNESEQYNSTKCWHRNGYGTADKKTICFFCGDISNKGGTERIATHIASSLADMFHDEYNVLILSIVETKSELSFPVSQRVKRYTLRDSLISSYIQYIPLVFKLRRFLNTHKVDVLINVDSVLDMVAIPARNHKKTAVISWSHFAFDESLGTFYRTKFRSLFAPHVDGIVTLTEHDKKRYNETYKLKHDALCIHNPITIREGTIYNDTAKTILSVGALVPVKGFDLMIEIAEKVFALHPDWQWIILGDGAEREALESETKRKGLERNVKFMGFVNDVFEYYGKASIFAVTSRSEGFTLALLEARAAKLPAIYFDIGSGVSEIMEPNVNALCAKKFDTDDFAKKLCMLIESPELRRTISSRAYVGIERLQSDYILKRWHELISSVCMKS